MTDGYGRGPFLPRLTTARFVRITPRLSRADTPPMSPMTRSNARRAAPHSGAPQSGPWRRVRWDTGARLTCLLTTLHPERALSRALVQHLSLEMPDIKFSLDKSSVAGGGEQQAVWVCGYEAGSANLVAELRTRHPRATLVVTGRGPTHRWEDEVRAAGADFVCSWPIPYARLSQLLHCRRVNPLS